MAASGAAKGGLIIAAVAVGSVAAFAWTAGFLTPDRLAPERYIAALRPPGGAKIGDRRNHAHGVCVIGTFQSTGAGAALSRAAVFRAGTSHLLGRFSLGSPAEAAPEASTRVRGFAFQITSPDGAQWRSAMIDVPFFPVATPAAFLQLLQAGGSKDPDALGKVAAAHPELKNFGGWAKTAPWTPSFAEERYNSIDAFVGTDAAGNTHHLRWSLLPTTPVDSVAPAALTAMPKDFLDQDLQKRLGAAPLSWTMVLTEAAPGDDTADPSKAWPADRKTVTAGTITLTQSRSDADGPCRDVNFDPTVLPSGLATGDDPFPAARSAVYAVSFNRRTAEEAAR